MKSLRLVMVILLGLMLALTPLLGACAEEEEVPPPPPAEEEEEAPPPPPPSPMDVAKEFYQGKIIELIVDAAAGSGPDRAARALHPYLEQVTGATVVVKNIEAAGGLQAHATVWNAEPDGLTIGLSTFDSLMLFDLLDDPGAVYEVDKFGYLGCMGQETSVFWVQADGPYDKSIADLKAMEDMKIAGHQPASGITLGLMTAAYLMDLDVTIATGFSSREGPMAVFRGDSAAFVSSAGSYLRYVEQGAKALCIIDVTATEALPDVLLLADLVELSADQEELLAVKSILHSGRVLFTTPGIPEERLAFLQQGYEQISQMQDFVVDAGKIMGYDNPPLPTAEETYSLVEDLKAQESYVRVIVKLMQERYIR